MPNFTEIEYKTTAELVEFFLKTNQQCVNSDKMLTYRVLEAIARKNGQKVFIPFALFEQFPSYETVARCRRKLNEQGKYLPTSEVVKARRANRERHVRELMRN